MIITSDIRFQERLKQGSVYLVTTVLIIAILVLAGWSFDIKFLIHPLPKLPAMNPTTAVTFILFAISFFLLTKKNNTKLNQREGKIIAFIVLFIGTIKLSEFIFGFNSKIDTFLFPVKILAESIDPFYALMSPVAAACFLLAGLSLLMLNVETRRKRMPSHYMALIIIYFGLASFLGYIFTVKAFYGDLSYVTMAIHTGISFIFIAVAMLLSTPDKGLMKELTKPFAGSIVARRLIPIAIFIPVALGLVRLYLQLNQIVPYEVGITLVIMCVIISLLGFIFYTSVLLNKRDFESKETEEALTETNYFLNTILENIPDMIFVKDAEALRFFRFNKAGEKLLGYSRNELIGKNDYDFFPKEQADFFTLKDREVLKGNSMIDIPEEPITTKNGERWIHTRKIPVHDEHGTPLYLVGIAEDITGRRKVEEQLRQLNAELEQKVVERTAEIRRNEARFRALIENSREGVVMIDKDFVRIYRSPSNDRITGWTTEERMKFKSITDTTHPDDVYIVKQVMDEMLANPKKPVHLSYRAQHKAGHYIWLDGFLTNMLDDEVLKAIVFNFRDITERKENELKIEQSEKKYRNLFENNPMPMWITDFVTSKFMDVNEAAIRHYGYSREEFLSMTAVDIRPDEDRELYIKSSSESHEGPENRGIWRHLKKDGKLIYAEIILYDILFEGKKARLILSNDVTARRQAEEEVNKLTRELRELLEHIQTSREEERKYIAREIHDELGQRLTALKIDVSMMRRKIPDNGNKNYFTDEINSVINQIDQSIESVKRIATDLRPEILDHHGIMEAIKWQAEHFESIFAIQCRIEHLPKDLNLESEISIAVYRIVQEALTNVARHSQATTASILIELKSEKLLVQIKDNGKGINEDEIKSIKSLGLIGIRERVHLLKGTLSIEGKPGEGTIVSALVPVKENYKVGLNN